MKYDYNVCKNNIFTKISNHFLIKETNSYCEVIQFCIFNKSRKYPRWQWLLRRTLIIMGVPMDTDGSVSSMSSFVVSPYRSRKDPPNLEIWMCNFPAICNDFFIPNYQKQWFHHASRFSNTVHNWDGGGGGVGVIKKIGMYFLLPCTQRVGGV